MKKYTINNSKIFHFITGLIICLGLSSFLLHPNSLKNPKNIDEILKEIPLVDSFKIIKSDSFFVSTYEVWFRMPLDHHNPQKGYFPLRTYFSHKSFSAPMLAILDGYTMYTSQSHELAHILGANQLTIEHRFFSNSRPTDSIPWAYLNIRQAAADEHSIIEAFKPYYKNKWISTGISKSGQTTIFHRRFYPNDVDVSIPYVAPLNFSNNDKRIHQFLNQVGTEKCRNKLKAFQKALFKRKEELFPLFKELANKNHWTYKLGPERAYDLSVLECEFSFWQWNGQCSTIPKPDADKETLFAYWETLNTFTFLEDSYVEKVRPFFYQAMNELGMYSYDITPFKEFLKDTTDIIMDFTMPEGHTVSFDSTAMKDIQDWINTSGNYMLYIYGEIDPWSATSVIPNPNTNAVKMVKPSGHHGTRIKNFPVEMQDSIYKTLSKWLKLKLPVNE